MEKKEIQRKLPFDAYGVECGSGWKGLYGPLIDLCKLYGIGVVQVKEKFGGLRFYTSRVDDRVDSLIAAAEAMSYHTCEDCGNRKVKSHDEKGRAIYEATTGPLYGDKGWIKTLCPPCRAKRVEELEAWKKDTKATNKALLGANSEVK